MPEAVELPKTLLGASERLLEAAPGQNRPGTSRRGAAKLPKHSWERAKVCPAPTAHESKLIAGWRCRALQNCSGGRTNDHLGYCKPKECSWERANVRPTTPCTPSRPKPPKLSAGANERFLVWGALISTQSCHRNGSTEPRMPSHHSKAVQKNRSNQRDG